MNELVLPEPGTMVRLKFLPKRLVFFAEVAGPATPTKWEKFFRRKPPRTVIDVKFSKLGLLRVDLSEGPISS